MSKSWLLVLCAAGACLLSGAANAQQELDWWQRTVFYQIYPRSFQDSNGDGVGDLIGITSRLEHFRDLGVEAVWLSPIFKSPMIDFGYDISDFRDIDPIFGTLADFDAFVARAKELGIRVILDFVANHSSDEHDWFVRSLANEPAYRDYYVWVDPKGFDENGLPIPPNNWVSVFIGSAWTYREERQQFYLHQFDPKQPDLNYRNVAVQQEMKDVLTFWLDRGVDGFRIDAIPHQYEAASLPDEPLTNYPDCQPTDYCYLDHIYTKSQPETFEMVKDWRRLVDAYSLVDNQTRVLMTEAYADINTTMDYYGDAENPGAHFTFNFELINSLREGSNAGDVVSAVHRWMDNMRPGFTPNWVIGNHDQKRAGTRFGSSVEDGMNALVLLLPGVAVTYYGEEIGMTDTFITWEETQDPPGCNAGPDRYQEFSRDPERTPYQWDETLNAGFSTGEKTWLPVNPNYLLEQLNLAAQKAASTSHYLVYKRLVEARLTRAIQLGSYRIQAVGGSAGTVFLARELEGESTFVLLLNMSDADDVVDLSSVVTSLPASATVFVGSINSGFNQGDSVTPTSVSLPSKASVVLTF